MLYGQNKKQNKNKTPTPKERERKGANQEAGSANIILMGLVYKHMY